MTTLADLKARFLKDPAFRVAYEEADAEYRPIEEEIRRRAEAAAKPVDGAGEGATKDEPTA